MISFVIPAHNEAQLVGTAVRAVNHSAEALALPYEVLVVDDASTDDTSAAARQAGARVVRVNLRHIAATRNAGARASQGEYLIFVDADTLVNEGVIRAAVAAMRHGAVGGGATPVFDGPVPGYARVGLALIVGGFRRLGLAAGCLLFATREAFELAGGFDESLFAAEEVALSRALGRLGRFVVLREKVTTSGRKFRTHSSLEVFRLLARMALSGRGALRSRESLSLWYGRRRNDLLPPGSG
jgi:glycosyltransferase involved in cell wall biosynthesis